MGESPLSEHILGLVAPLRACAASDAAGAALPAQVAIPAVLVAAAAQAAGTGTLVASEFRGELLKQQQRLAASASGRAFQTTQGAPREPVTWQAAVAALGIRWSGGAAVWGVATAVVAAAAVATISLALAALSDAGAASGNTQALREVLLGADGGSGSGGGSLPLPLLAAALLLAECVLAPLAEELVFRRVLLCALAPAPAPVAGPAMVPAPAAHLGALELETAQVQQQEQQQQQPDSAAAPRPPASAAIAAAEAAASNAPAMPSAGSPPPASAGAEAGKGITAAPPPVLAWRPEWLGPLSLQAAAFAAYHLNPGEVLPQAALGGVLGLAYLASGRNLAVPLAGHALYNGAAVALLLLQP
ncbi:hypothetical protein HXX76_006814 [Chlamydomonas incerta]|uniref:CAAX prenyl protease 2/Lysostaphin resistance protein A-like domain-containing protein n=1 Tax=Chlamydomonas incerta TaxID=51695 RepID=A0A835T367_CHLIN|nr:hypothetical protein HXX76_006814 [Chlamydomonas incerta]|eukprot:KAG2436516.1 hypothetical protein HXX76_006814 [Chlamydomonas incerta]